MGILEDAKKINKVIEKIPVKWFMILVVCFVCLTILFSAMSFRLNGLERSQDFDAGVRSERVETARYLLHYYGEAHVLKFRNWLEKEDAK